MKTRWLKWVLIIATVLVVVLSLLWFIVDESDTVKRGQLLAEIASGQLDASYLNAKENVSLLKAQVEQADTDLSFTEKNTAASISAAEAELSGAQSDEIKAKNALELSKAVLARIVGITRDYDLKDPEHLGVDTLLSQEPSLVTVSCQPEPMNCFKTIALSERVELKGLELQKKIGQEQVKYTQDRRKK